MQVGFDVVVLVFVCVDLTVGACVADPVFRVEFVNIANAAGDQTLSDGRKRANYRFAIHIVLNDLCLLC